MKKNYILLIFTIFVGLCYSQTVTITKVIETDCSSPFIKTVELAVEGTVDFANDDIQLRYSNNGGGFDPSGDNSAPNLIDISGLGVQSNTYVYVIRDLTLMQSEFPSAGITAANSVLVGTATNGDDAYQLAKADGTVLSQFGEDLTDGTGTVWAHNDTFFSRKTGNNNTGWDINDWDSQPEDYLDPYGQCAKSATGTNGALLETVITLGSWKTLSSSDFTKSELSIYPNPVNSGLLNIKSQISGTKTIQLYDIMGRNVLQTTLNSDVLDVSSVNSGLYLLKIAIDGRTATKKIVVK